MAAIDPFGGPDEEDPELYPDPSADWPPFANQGAGDDDVDHD